MFFPFIKFCFLEEGKKPLGCLFAEYNLFALLLDLIVQVFLIFLYSLNGFWTFQVHENAYISDFHHCFSVSSNSLGRIFVALFYLFSLSCYLCNVLILSFYVYLFIFFMGRYVWKVLSLLFFLFFFPSFFTFLWWFVDGWRVHCGT